VTLGRTEFNNRRTLCLLMEFAKMMLGHKSKDDVTESYIRVSDEMRLRFYDYLELIVGEKSAERGSSPRLFKGISP
jgi:hypothetical protein